MSARTIRQADGLDPVRALQRVLYRSAKQEPKRRFHALYDKLTRSDVMWRGWVDVATNEGAPGIDGVTIAEIEAEGAEGVRRFLDGLAEELKGGTYRPKALLSDSTQRTASTSSDTEYSVTGRWRGGGNGRVRFGTSTTTGGVPG